MSWRIRSARGDDAGGISRVILSALRETNAKDYPAEVIGRVGRSFSPSAVTGLLARRRVFVAAVDEAIVGTAGFDGEMVRTVFVDPAWQGRGIGRALMAEVEREAIKAGSTVLAVRSSLTAEPFYAKLGFSAVGESSDGEERTVVMKRRLSGARVDG